MKNRRNKTYRLTIRSILTALIFIQGMVPFLGFIPLGMISLTIVHITVIVAAVTLGTKDGMFIGFVWGLTTFIRAWTMPSSAIDPIVFINPIVSILPRILVGLVAGLLFTVLYKKIKTLYLPTIIAAIGGTLTNTVLVLSLMGVLYTGPVAEHFSTTPSQLMSVLGLAVLTNGIPEIIAAVIITPLIVKALFQATSLSPESRNN